MPDLSGARIDPKTGDIILRDTPGTTNVTTATIAPGKAAYAYVSAATAANTVMMDLRTIQQGRNIVLTALDADTVSINAIGSVSQITVEGIDGILVEGSPITTSGTLNFKLASSGVVPGDYVNAKLTVDRTGRILQASNGVTIPDVAGRNLDGDGHVFSYVDGSTLVFRALTAGPGIDIQDAGNAVVISATSANGSGTSGLLTVSNGALTANVVTSLAFPGSALAVNGGLATLTFPNGVQSVSLQGSADILTGNTPVTSSGTLTASLSNTGVVAGVYSNATFRVDSKGRLLSASSGSGAGASAPVQIAQRGTIVSTSLSSLNFTGNAVSVSADTQGHVAVQVNAPTAYSFQINYDVAGGIASVSGVPTGWSVLLSGSTLTITHNLGAVVPLYVSAYGFNGSFPGQYTQRLPVGTSMSAFSFAVNASTSTFTLYNATYTNTSAAVGGFAIVRILV